MIRAACLAAALLATGCAHGTTGAIDESPAPSHVAPPTAYRVVLSPALANTADVAPYVLAAIDAWTAAAPGLTLTTSIGACPTGPATICLDASDATSGAYLGWTETSADASSTITLYVALMRAEPPEPLAWERLAQTIAGHELGHALGLVHSGPGNLMNTDPATVAETPSAGDVQAFESMRGAS